MKPHTPQRQFKRPYVPQEAVQPHSMDNREAAAPTANKKRDSRGLGTGTTARPGLSGLSARSKLSKPKQTRELKAR
jgi:hypothetical protein